MAPSEAGEGGSVLQAPELTEISAPTIPAVYACVKWLNEVVLTEGSGVRTGHVA